MKLVHDFEVHTDPTTSPTLPHHEDGLRHEAAVKMILDALRTDLIEAYYVLAFHLYALLTPEERQDLTSACLLACGEEGAEKVVEQVLPGRLGAGMPPPPLTDDELDLDAEFWATAATTREIRAYFVAAYRRLPTKARQALLAQLAKEAV